MNEKSENLKQVRLGAMPLDAGSERYAKEIATLDGVKGVVLLPDAFTKEKYIDLDYKITIPSSSVIVTDSDTLYPQFRSRGINCGMMAIALPVQRANLTDDLVTDILHALTYDPLYFLNHRFRLPFYRDRYDLSYKDFLSVIQEGVPYLLERYGHNVDDIAAMDFGGSYKAVDLKATRELLNERWLEKRTIRMRTAFGRYFGGNHFFELQEAQTDSPELNVKKGQVVALVHTGCQGLEAVVRKDLAQRFIHQKSYQKVQKGEEMYEAFFIAQALLMNLGYAYRFTTFAILNDVIKKHGLDKATILSDKSHNYVHKETVNDKEILVYRHNVERLEQDGRAIISGRYDAPSYIVKGGERISEIYNSIDHGLGKIIDSLEGSQEQQSGTQTELYRFYNGIYQFAQPERKIEHIKPAAADAYFDIMRSNGYCKPIGTFSPFLNLKYTK